MLNIMLRLFGERALHKAMARSPRNNPLDVKFGISLLRDRRIPLSSKLIAFGMGAGILAILLAVEVPLEAIVTFLAPILMPLDFALDGFELIALPLLLMALLIAYVAPRQIVDQIRDERTIAQNGPVIDVQATDPNAMPPALASAPVSLAQRSVYAGLRQS